ncbi:HEAT repeat domain-containing protein [Luteimicrobium sp. NPDC057192]|uniref:HEAT repeat domain-containing protein n=1 Tax=Luteimicrobium sp. NPDC057192 TaxID=3346042 RepID=UPI003634C2D5
MARRDAYRTDLTALLAADDGAAAVRGYLAERSGLPGPRANLELVAAFADVAPGSLARELARSDDEYERVCGVVGLGRLLVEAPDGGSTARSLVAALRGAAVSESWREREAVAMALQRLGDADPRRLRDVVAAWAPGPDPLVARAAVAGICEPRLLSDPATARAAIDACREATGLLAAVPADRRREPAVRTLRQALGYCWSVVVAGAPEAGLPVFEELGPPAADDRDLDWVVRTNLRKARLQRVLVAAERAIE